MDGIEFHDYGGSLQVGVVHYNVHFILPERKLLQPRNWEGNPRSFRFLYEDGNIFKNVVSHILQVGFNISELLIFLHKTVDQMADGVDGDFSI